MVCSFFVNQLIYGQAYDFTQYGIEQGIAHEQVTDICQDVKGNLWIATLGGGVSKFNGITFQNYTIRDGLLSNYVRKLTTDNEGNVWMATAEGISKYNGVRMENDHTLRYASDKSVNSILIDKKQNLWYATAEQGVSIVNKDGYMQSFDQSNGFVNDRVIDIKEGEQGEIWLVTIVNGVYKYENNEFSKIISISDVKGYILSITIQDNHILITTNRGVFKYDQNLSYLLEFKDMFIKSVTSRGDELWLITANSLVLNKGNINKDFSKNEGFSSKLATVSFSDREGNLWIGTNGDGIYKFTNSAFVKLDKRHGLLNDNITTILKDRHGKYWYGSNGDGVFQFDGENVVNYSTKNGLPNNYVTSSVLDNKGEIWFGTRGGGLVNYDGNTFKNYLNTDGLVHNNIRKIYYSEQGDLWIATINGVSKWDGEVFENFSTENGLLDNVVWNILERDGLIYFVTRKGINVFEDGELRSFYEDEAVFNKRINTIRFSIKGELLVGYSGYGFRLINLDSNTHTWISTEDGLVSNIIHDIEQIENEVFLVTTERGIDLLTLRNNKLVSINHMANRNSGLGLAKTNPGALFRDNEHIWIGTQSGVYCYNYGLDNKIKVPPIIYLSTINLLNDENIEINNNDNKIYELKYTQNSLGISYFGNHLNDAEGIVYQYKMSDFQDDWSIPSKSISTMFTNLPSGDYTFLVRANSNGTLSDKPAIFRFKIIPPVWEQSWFYFLMTLLVVALVRYIYLYRIKENILKVLELEKVREEEATKVRKTMARDFHDNMGNQLASITVFSSLISLKLKNKTVEIDDLLKNIEKHSKSLYNGTKDFIWSMNPESDNLNEIFTYLKDFGEDFLSKTNIDFYADNEVLGQHIEVPSGWSRQIVLIFKEAMTNSLKHSNANKLYISLQLVQGSFVMKCSDNGTGMNDDEIRKGNGYRNMNSRAKQIGCDLIIENKKDDSGLEVTLRGELPKKEESDAIKIF